VLANGAWGFAPGSIDTGRRRGLRGRRLFPSRRASALAKRSEVVLALKSLRGQLAEPVPQGPVEIPLETQLALAACRRPEMRRVKWRDADGNGHAIPQDRFLVLQSIHRSRIHQRKVIQVAELPPLRFRMKEFKKRFLSQQFWRPAFAARL